MNIRIYRVLSIYMYMNILCMYMYIYGSYNVGEIVENRKTNTMPSGKPTCSCVGVSGDVHNDTCILWYITKYGST